MTEIKKESPNDLVKMNDRLVEILSPESGYFGRIFTWGQRSTAYEHIGYILTEDFLPTLQKMSIGQEKSLAKTMNYFWVHSHALKYLLGTYVERKNDRLYCEIVWSQFMIVIMFGMLEIVAKGDETSLYRKEEKIKKFLEDNLSQDFKDKISERYFIEDGSKYKEREQNFGNVIDHLWSEVRSGFIHDASMQSISLEWQRFEGLGTRDNPMTIRSLVPVQEFLQMAWQSILHSYGYNGSLELPKWNKKVGK
jgi:hypothetical protein